MSDFVWFILTGILLALLGIVFSVLGWLIWKKQRMDLIISYHSDKVSEANKPAYCALLGTGVLIMGIGFLASATCTVFIQSARVFVPMAAGLLAGAVLLVSAIIKYNR